MQANAQELEHISLITTPIQLLKGNVVISQGTGFYYFLDDSTKGKIIFLVTNYHVLTGNSPSTGKLPGFSDFSVDEFKSQKKDLQKLCETIKLEGYEFGMINASENTIDWLNGILQLPYLYDKVTEKKTNLTLTDEIKKLREQTAEKRKGQFKDLSDNEQKRVKRLNRLMIELAYPQETPKIQLPKGDNIKFYFHKDPNNPGEVNEIRLPLFSKEEKEVWIASDDYPDADVAAIPILSAFTKGVSIYAITENWTKSNMKIRPTSTITLVGYPYGFFDKKNWLPIWKTGTIATEPSYNFEGKPLMLIDISAFPGMSGSPAFAIANGAYQTVDGPTTVGQVRMFLGIYASMQMITEAKYLEELAQKDSGKGINISSSLELGHIWKADLIVNMIKHIDVKKYEEEIIKKLF